MFPTLEIAEPPNPELLIPQLKNPIDIAVFTSANAVDKAIPYIQDIQKLKTWKIAAIGAATARALTSCQLPVDACPSEFNSEGLLALPLFEPNAIKNKTIMIFKGAGGRELLKNTLEQRGAHVIEAIVYQRRIPALELPDWQADAIQIIISTSHESLQNLVTLTGTLLKQVPLIVISKRMAAFAEQPEFKQRFKQPSIVAENASDSALLTAFIDWRNRHD